jgi:hypothetical protein
VRVLNQTYGVSDSGFSKGTSSMLPTLELGISSHGKPLSLPQNRRSKSDNLSNHSDLEEISYHRFQTVIQLPDSTRQKLPNSNHPYNFTPHT